MAVSIREAAARWEKGTALDGRGQGRFFLSGAPWVCPWCDRPVKRSVKSPSGWHYHPSCAEKVSKIAGHLARREEKESD